MPKLSDSPPSVVSLAQHLAPGQYKKACPLCQHTREHNAKDRPLSLKVDSDGVKYHCHHCDEAGGWLHSDVDPSSISSTHAAVARPSPITIPKAKASDAEIARDYLLSRGIAESVIEAHTVAGTFSFRGKRGPAIGFPYRDSGGEVTAVKWRSVTTKAFSQQNTCRDLFLLDTYVDGNDIILCEGEIDALAWLSAGLPENITVMSIPNGAPARVKEGRTDPKDDNKFQYLWQAKDRLERAARIYLSTDNDEPGRALATEITRRLDKRKLWTISLSGGHKDAGDALLEGGPSALLTAFNGASAIPMVGLATAGDYADRVQDIYEHGLTSGASTGLASLDKHMTVAPGMLTIVTGFPGSGKSDLIDQICLNLAIGRGWRTVFCSFEKPGELHLVQLCEKLTGRPFFPDEAREEERMTPGDRDASIDWLNQHFTFMDYRRGGASDIDGILAGASAAVMRMGCRILVIDPYNYITVDRNGMETDAISDLLTKVQTWAKVHDCHVFFIAHPRMISNEQAGRKVVPTGHNIAKSAAWFAKADTGLSVWRDMSDDDAPSEAHIWKVKWSWLGNLGYVPLTFNKLNSRWSDFDPADDDFDWDF